MLCGVVFRFMSAAASTSLATSGRVPCYETYLCKEQIGLVSVLLVRLDSRLQTLTLILTLTLGPSPNPSGGNGITVLSAPSGRVFTPYIRKTHIAKQFVMFRPNPAWIPPIGFRA